VCARCGEIITGSAEYEYGSARCLPACRTNDRQPVMVVTGQKRKTPKDGAE